MIHQLARDQLDLLALLIRERRVGPSQQIEHRELGLGEPLAHRSLLLLRELPGERLESTQHLVDVEAAGVVSVDQLAQPLDQIHTGRVASPGALDSIGQIAQQAPRRGPFLTGQAGGKGLEVDGVEVDQRLGVRAVGGRADHVLLGTDRAVEQLPHGARNARNVGRLVERADALRKIARHSHEAHVPAGRRVGQDRGEQAAHPVRALEVAAPRHVLHEQRLHRRVT